MTITYGRLSALPGFLKSDDFWQGVLDPRLSIEEGARFGHVREFSSTHAWALEPAPGYIGTPPNGTELTVIELGLGILQRGAWTPCSWLVEKSLAERASADGLCVIDKLPSAAGQLGYDAKPVRPRDFFLLLVTGRLASEVQPGSDMSMWDAAVQESASEGSEAERAFFDDVLVPVLGFPLLDYLRFQTHLHELGITDPAFTRQRTDFSIETGRGLKLVIEIDGQEHQEPSQKLLDNARDKALEKCGWLVWRIPVSKLQDVASLKRTLLDKMSSACWRGYVASWQIVNGSLFLASIDGTFQDGSPARVEDLFRNYSSQHFESAKANHPDNEGPGQFAFWVNDPISCPIGKLLHHEHSGYMSVYQRTLQLNTRNGHIIGQKIIDNEPYVVVN